jgi:glutamate-1-semialdehyde 2,1-aminomutase
VLAELDDESYVALERTATRLADGLAAAAADAGIAAQLPRVFTIAGLFFSEHEVRDYDEAKACDADRFGRFFHGMLEHGIFLAPSAFESMFPSLAHTDADIDRTIAAAHDVLASVVDV